MEGSQWSCLYGIQIRNAPNHSGSGRSLIQGRSFGRSLSSIPGGAGVKRPSDFAGNTPRPNQNRLDLSFLPPCGQSAHPPDLRGLLVIGKILHGGFQAGAVGRELPGRDGEQLPGRAALGIGGGEEVVQEQHPVMATIFPCAFQALTMRTLCSGWTRA